MLALFALAGLACNATPAAVPSVQRMFAGELRRAINHGWESRLGVASPLPLRRSERVRLPSEPRLAFGYSAAFSQPGKLSTPIRVDLIVRDGDARESVVRSRILPDEKPRWRDEVVSLGAWAGRTVEIVIKASFEGGSGQPVIVDPSAAFFWTPPVVYSAIPDPSRPDVILIGVDTLRADRLGCYGATRDTSPAIDALSARGVLFEQAYSQSSWTLPSFGSILTGLYPTHHGALRRQRTKLPTDIVNLADLFRRNGYLTVGFHAGGYLSALYGYGEHFDVYDQLEGFRSIDAVSRWLDARAGLPVLMFLHTYDVHAPYGSVPPRYHTLYTDPDHSDVYDLVSRTPSEILNERGENPFDEEDYAHQLALYDGEIRYVDDQLGRLFTHLEREGRLGRTLIALVADHGDEFGEHGGVEHGRHLHRELLHVPLIVAGPGIARGRRVPAIVQTVDLLPTIVDLLGFERVDLGALDGRSFAGMLRPDSALSTDDAARFTVGQLGPKRWSLRTKSWTLIASPEGTELYDRSVDPAELHDLSAEKPEVVFRLAAGYREAVGAAVRESPATEAPSAEVLEQLKALGYVE